jgi:serine/threonine-protein kinase HipA
MYSHNPAGKWTNQHQLSLNGKRDHFTRADLIALGDSISLTKPADIIQHILDTVAQWPQFAEQAGLKNETMREIAGYHRTPW